MAGGREGDRSSQEYSKQSNTHSKEHGGGDKEGNVNTPLVPLMQEQQSWYERPHEELVKAFQDFVQQRYQLFGGYFSPVEIIRSKLVYKEISLNKIERDFFSSLRSAWDVLAFDRYEPGSSDENLAARSLQSYYRCTREPVIKLSHPIQIRIIDALTEAVGIPHQIGQAEIEIPEKIRNYDEWRLSREYQERVTKAKSQ